LGRKISSLLSEVAITITEGTGGNQKNRSRTLKQNEGSRTAASERKNCDFEGANKGDSKKATYVQTERGITTSLKGNIIAHPRTKK